MSAKDVRPKTPEGAPRPAPKAAAAARAPAAAAAGKPAGAVVMLPPRSVETHLFEEAFDFDFFQAVRLLALLGRLKKRPTGARVSADIVRFRAHASLTFPPSSIYEIEPPTGDRNWAIMTVAFMGLTGPSGVLPYHYTQLQLQLQLQSRAGPDRFAMRDWLDLFNHRMIYLFYRAWEKYRFYLAYERREFERSDPDTYSLALFSLIGMGTPTHRNRFRIAEWHPVENDERGRENVLAWLDDLSLLHYSGMLSQRHRNASGLQAILQDFFQLPVRIRQFQGQWLLFDPVDQSRLGTEGANSMLGMNLVVGQRVWDVQGRIRVRLGPLKYSQFAELLPDPAIIKKRKAFFLLVHLVRFYVGPALDFDVQLILRGNEVPACRLTGTHEIGARLGWNTWLICRPPKGDLHDVVLEGKERVWINRDFSARPPITPL